MNKAFLREPDQHVDYCPRCGSAGQTVSGQTLRSHVPQEKWGQVAEPASYCPSAQCDVVYFDPFERVLSTADLKAPVYPKDPTAPICACFGLTRDDIESDIREGAPTRARAVLEKAKSPEARCTLAAANGRSCVAYVQKYYLQCLEAAKRGQAGSS